MVEKRFREHEETAHYLDKNSPAYMGGILEMCNARPYKFWNDLGPALKSGQPQNEVKHSQKPMFETLYEDLPRLEQFMGAMAGLSRGKFMTLAEKFDLFRNTKPSVTSVEPPVFFQRSWRKNILTCDARHLILPAVEPIAKKVELPGRFV